MIITKIQQERLLGSIVTIQYELGIIAEGIDTEKEAKALGMILKELSQLALDIGHSEIKQMDIGDFC